MADHIQDPKLGARAALSDADYERLSAYIDGELSETESQQVEKQVRESPALRAALGRLLDLDDSLRAMAQAEELDDWADLVHQSPARPAPPLAVAPAQSEGRSVSLRWAFAMAAGCLLAATLGLTALLTLGGDDVPEQYPVVTVTVTNGVSAEGSGGDTVTVHVRSLPTPAEVSLGTGSAAASQGERMEVASNEATSRRLRASSGDFDRAEEPSVELESDSTTRARRSRGSSRERVRERDRDRSAREDADDPVSATLSQIGAERAQSSLPSAEQQEREENEALAEELTTSQVSRTIRRYQRRLAECRRLSALPAGDALRIDVAITIQGDGRVASARADSSDGAAHCIEEVVLDMRFDEFSGEPMSFTYPFRIR